MAWLGNLLSPITVAFLVIVTGYFIGRIKICGISLDLAGVLVVAVGCGFGITATALGDDPLYVANMQSYMKMFSSFGTALFVSVVGITAGYSMHSTHRRDGIAAMIGGGMVAAGIAVMKGIAAVDTNISISSLLGILCGALTTTPGLSAVCELPGIVSEEAVLGYGGAYLFGVVFTVLFVQMIARRGQESPRVMARKKEASKGAFGGLIQICLTVILGNLIGCVELPIIRFSLGSSGGILCAGLLLGGAVWSRFPEKTAASDSMGLFRNLGLVLFFVGAGIPAGMQLQNGFDLRTIVYGMLMTVAPILAGCLLCGIFSRKCKITPSSVVAGGMTSTPAIGVLMRKSREISLSEYSFSYVGALGVIVVGVRFLA